MVFSPFPFSRFFCKMMVTFYFYLYTKKTQFEFTQLGAARERKQAPLTLPTLKGNEGVGGE